MVSSPASLLLFDGVLPEGVELDALLRPGKIDRVSRGNRLAVEDPARLSGRTRDARYDSSMEKAARAIEEYATFPAVQEEMALPIRGRQRNLSRKDLVDVFAIERLGLEQRAVEDVPRRMARAFPDRDELIRRSPLPEGLRAACRDLLAARRKRQEIRHRGAAVVGGQRRMMGPVP